MEKSIKILNSHEIKYDSILMNNIFCIKEILPYYLFFRNGRCSKFNGVLLGPSSFLSLREKFNKIYMNLMGGV